MKRNSFIRRGSVSLLLSGMLAFCSFPVTAAVTLAQALDEPAEETDTAESETQESEMQVLPEQADESATYFAGSGDTVEFAVIRNGYDIERIEIRNGEETLVMITETASEGDSVVRFDGNLLESLDAGTYRMIVFYKADEDDAGEEICTELDLIVDQAEETAAASDEDSTAEDTASTDSSSKGSSKVAAMRLRSRTARVMMQGIRLRCWQRHCRKHPPTWPA